jgi:uncharacterized protein (DUF302 family)
MIKIKQILTAVCLLGVSAAVPAADTNTFNAVFKTQGDFETVRDTVAAAVEGQGLKITHINKISGMLDNTAAAVGDAKKIYLNAEQMEFCSATVSRQMMAADPHNIVACPYIISVYNLPGDARTIYVAYRKPPLGNSPKAKAAFAAVDKLFRTIIQDGIQ